MAGSGDITVWLHSPGGDCVAAAQIYNMLMDYKGSVTVKIDGIAASAASVIAMAGTKVLMSPEPAISSSLNSLGVTSSLNQLSSAIVPFRNSVRSCTCSWVS